MQRTKLLVLAIISFFVGSSFGSGLYICEKTDRLGILDNISNQKIFSNERCGINLLEFIEEVIIDSSAHSWNTAAWDQSKIITYGDYQYVAFWDSDHRLALARRNLQNNEIQTIIFSDILSDPDDPHRSTPIGISPHDGRLHIAYDHHNNPINYRVSDEGFITNPPYSMSINYFSDNLQIVPENRVTYPRFYNTPSDELHLMFRNGSASKGDTYIYRYDSIGGSWYQIGMLFTREGTYGESTLRNAYENDIVFDQAGRMHITWTWREGKGHENNHDICYAYSDDNGITWKNNEGLQIANLDYDETISVESPGITVIDVPLYSMLMNTGSMDVDSDNQPHIFIYLSRPAKRVHYWRTPGGEWHQQYIEKELLVSKNTRPRGDVFIDDEDTIYHIFLDNYSMWSAIAEKDDNWANWTIDAFDTLNNTRTNLKYDRFRWKNERIVSLPINEKNDENNTFALRDYYFPQPSELVSDANGPYNGIINNPITFTGEASGGCIPYSWHWDFGNGLTSNNKNPTNQYNLYGNYTIILEVSDDEGQTDSDITYAVIYNPELVANSKGPYYGLINGPIQFYGSASGGYPPYEFHWDFGDDSQSKNQFPNHSYLEAGHYNLNLTVIDTKNNQAYDQSMVYITAENNPPSQPIISGEINGKAGVEYEYIFSSFDSNDDDIYYEVQWEEMAKITTYGPYPSGQEIVQTHIWLKKDNYTIRARARDLYGAESDWAILNVQMSKTLIFYKIIFKTFYERFLLFGKMINNLI